MQVNNNKHDTLALPGSCSTARTSVHNCCTWNSYHILQCHNRFHCYQSKHSCCMNCNCLLFQFLMNWRPLTQHQKSFYCPTATYMSHSALTLDGKLNTKVQDILLLVQNWPHGYMCDCYTHHNCGAGCSDQNSCGSVPTKWQEIKRFH